MSTPKDTRHIKTLDGWRTLAISMVLVAHADLALGDAGPSAFRSFAKLAAFGELGVDIFFCLSGYLICTLLLREKETVGRVSLGRFYARRVFRILPPALLYLATLVALTTAGLLTDVNGWEVLAAIAFYRNYSAQAGWYTGHFWSLAVEEHFYLIIPLLLSLTRRRTALVVAFVLAAASSASRAVCYYHGEFSDGPYFTFRTENRFDGLFCGAILALLLRDARVRERMTLALSPVRVGGLVVVTLVLLKMTSQPALSRTIVAWTMPLFIASTVLRPSTAAGRLLELPPVRWVGRLSYSLYLWQQFFLKNHDVPGVLGPIGGLQVLPQSLLALLACATASYYLVEKPMIRLGHRLAASPAPPVAPEAPTVPTADDPTGTRGASAIEASG